MSAPETKTLFIIRHGETDPNKNHIIQGSGLDAPLNSRGHQQAADFYSAYRHIPFGAIFTSALVRTHQSVAPFLAKGIPHFVLSDLNEISWGIKDGTQIDPEEQIIYNALLSDWKAGLLDRSFEKGESPNAVARRLRNAMDQILTSGHSLILVCIHGRALRILLCLLLEVPLTEMEGFLHSNLCLYVLHFDGNKWVVELSNNTDHLLA